jgi:hypothetical protein
MQRKSSPMATVTTAKARSNEERTDKHRKAHKLVQTWVSPELRKVLDALAKKEGRTLANWVRRELGKIAGIAE